MSNLVPDLNSDVKLELFYLHSLFAKPENRFPLALGAEINAQ